jgi:sugar/nucleoside kinase (ribokinase family)
VSITVVGTIGIDTIITPFGQAEDILGGSAIYFALAAAHFQPVNIVAVAGNDLTETGLTPVRHPNIDLAGIERAEGATFRWGGQYHLDFNTRDTLYTELGVLATFQPKVPERYRAADILFLANLQPTVQASVFAQIPAARIKALDTMNFWITSAHDELTEVLRKVDVVIMAEEELRQYADMSHLRAAAQRIFALGPRALVVKLGSYGALLLDADGGYFAAPGFPLDDVRDPTGAGDAFAGGFLGSLDAVLARGQSLTPAAYKRALIHGNIMGSFTCEAFGVERLTQVTADDIDRRYREIIAYTHVEAELAGDR